MRTAAQTFITNHRLARLNASMRLWLVWFAGACAAWWSGGERASARQLDALAYRVCQLIVVNTAARYTPKQRSPHRHGRLKSVRQRTIVGSAIRRAMRGKRAPHRLFAILAIVRDMDRRVTTLLRRLRRGLTRLRVIVLKPEPAPLFASAHYTPICADTS
jgi:hypothetical protein